MTTEIVKIRSGSLPYTGIHRSVLLEQNKLSATVYRRDSLAEIRNTVRRHFPIFRHVWLLMPALIVPVSSTDACPVCIPFPQQSAADHLISAETVVFAREDPDRHFAYAVLETLKGTPPGQDIGLFLPSASRRMLAADDQRVAVLVRDNAGTWRSLGIADSNYQQVVRRVVVFANEWNGAEGQQRRLQFFLDLFDHEDPLISRLAWLELSRAPYSTLRRFSRAIAPAELHPILADPQYIEWRPLAILLLANSGESADVEQLRNSFRTAERFSLTRNLAALATASIEFDGADAIQFITEQYLTEPARQEQELTEICLALSVHGTEGHIHLRDQIVESYGLLLETHPEMAPLIAADLIAWERWDLAEKIAEVADLTIPGSNLTRYLELANADQH